MTQEVDDEQFYLVGKGLFDNAKNLYDAFEVNVTILGSTGSMAGTDDAGTAWARSYDARVAEVLGAVNDLTLAMENYGRVVIQAGYNHAVAEHNATPGDHGPAPQRPADPPSATSNLSVPPSAGGSGEGLLDSAIGLVEQIGVPIPDGDTGKVDAAGQAWDRLATVYQTTTVVEALGVQASIFSDSKTPEDDYLATDINELRDAAKLILDGCAELSQSCRDYKSHLDELRKQLEDLLHELEIELAVTAAIAIAASFVSFGVGAIAGTAKAAHTIKKFADLIEEAIGAWKISKKVSEGVKKIEDIAGVRKKLERLKKLGQRKKPAEKPKPVPGKGQLKLEGEGFSVSERESAQELADRGHDVVLRQADPGGGRTSDLLVDGVPYDIYAPQTGNVDRLVSAIADKGSQVQGGGVVVDLRNSPLTPEQVGDLLPRVQGITDKVTDIIIIK